MAAKPLVCPGVPVSGAPEAAKALPQHQNSRTNANFLMGSVTCCVPAWSSARCMHLMHEFIPTVWIARRLIDEASQSQSLDI